MGRSGRRGVVLWGLGLLMLLGYGPTASAEVGDPYNHLISGGLIVNPDGLYTRYDYTEHLGKSGVGLGGYASYLVYSTEVGAKVSYTTDPAWLSASLDAGVDPGFFLKDDDPTRTFGLRYTGRGQVSVNIKLDHIWLYSRTTGLYRYRDFKERDTFQRLELDQELSIEQASAVFVRVAGTPDSAIAAGAPSDAAFWVYGEHTVGRVFGHITSPNRLSTGVVTERWLFDEAVFNLDVFYSFADNNPGLGAILLYWLYY